MINPYDPDRFEKNFERSFQRASRLVIGVWLVGSLVSLGMLGLVAWAIITLVNHFTS